MSAGLAGLLRAALSSRGQDLRLDPGSPPACSENGKTIALGDEPLTGEAVEDLIEGVLTPDARMDLALGSAEWTAEVGGVGTFSMRAELRGGATHVTVLLDGVGGRQSLPPVLGGMPAEDDEGEVLDLADDDVQDLEAPAARPAAARPAPSASRAPEPRGGDAVGPAVDPTATAGIPGPTAAQGVHQLLLATLQVHGSDLHLACGAHPMVRVEGDLRPMTLRGPLTAALLEEILWPIVPERARAEFARRRAAEFAHEIEGVARFRVSLFADRGGLGAAFRVVPLQVITAERLGLPAEALNLCRHPRGLVLVAGPAGSGKTTTLMALAEAVARSRSAHLVTIEDPIEFVLASQRCLVSQREVGTHATSATEALHAALREDPDVLVVGTVRDAETFLATLDAAEQGPLVFATLRAPSVGGALERALQWIPADRVGAARRQLADTLRGVVTQVLCRRSTGGRIAAYEVLLGTPAAAHLVREQRLHQIPTLLAAGPGSGMRSLNESLAALVQKGVVGFEEAQSRAHDPLGLHAMLAAAAPPA